MNSSGSTGSARVLPALLSAAFVAAIIFAQQVIGLLFGTIPWQIAGGQSVAVGLQSMAGSVITYILPFAIGVFVSLCLFAPVRDGMRLWPLVGRGLLASLVGAVAVSAVALLVKLFGGLGLIDFVTGLLAQIFTSVSTAAVAPYTSVVVTRSWATSACSCSSLAPYSALPNPPKRAVPSSMVISLLRRSPWEIW